MLEMVQQLQQGIILVVVFTLVAIGGIWIIVFRALRKSAKAANSTVRKDSENVRREDFGKILPYDDITDDGIVILDGGKRFVAGITVQGFDFYDKEVGKQQETMERYTNFFDMLPDGRVFQINYDPQLRQLSEYVDSYDKREDEITETLYDKLETCQLIENKLKKMDKYEPEYNVYVDKLLELQKECMSLTSQKEEVAWLSEYVKKISYSGEYANPEMVSNYFFDWSLSDTERMMFPDMTKDELMRRARKELLAKGNAYVGALVSAGLHAKMIDSMSYMVDVWRRYFRIGTSNNFTMDELLSNSVLEYVIDSTRSVRDIPNSGKNKDELNAVRLAAAHRRVIKERRERRKHI